MQNAGRVTLTADFARPFTPIHAHMGFAAETWRGQSLHVDTTTCSDEHHLAWWACMSNPSQWVLIKRFAEITGYSENAVRHKIKGGIWIEGRIWRKAPDGRIFVNLDEFERWVESDALVKAF